MKIKPFTTDRDANDCAQEVGGRVVWSDMYRGLVVLGDMDGEGNVAVFGDEDTMRYVGDKSEIN